MNETGKSEHICAEAVPSKTVVLGSNGMIFGPFDSPTDAWEWAKRQWPDQQQNDGDKIVDGWDVTALWPPQT